VHVVDDDRQRALACVASNPGAIASGAASSAGSASAAASAVSASQPAPERIGSNSARTVPNA
jgi:hypothetical protein